MTKPTGNKKGRPTLEELERRKIAAQDSAAVQGVQASASAPKDGAPKAQAAAPSTFEAKAETAKATRDLLAEVTARQNQTQDKKTREAKPGDKAPKAQAKKQPELSPELQKYGADATAAAEIGMLSAIFGEKFTSGYYGQKDHEFLATGWQYYFTYYGFPALPGWFVLIMAHVAYVGQRVGDKANREAIGKMFSDFKAKIFKGKVIDEKPSGQMEKEGADKVSADGEKKRTARPDSEAGLVQPANPIHPQKPFDALTIISEGVASSKPDLSGLLGETNAQ